MFVWKGPKRNEKRQGMANWIKNVGNKEPKLKWGFMKNMKKNVKNMFLLS